MFNSDRSGPKTDQLLDLKIIKKVTRNDEKSLVQLISLNFQKPKVEFLGTYSITNVYVYSCIIKIMFCVDYR